MIRPSPDLLRPRVLATWWWLALVPVAWFSLFAQLGAYPLQNWDEARLAVNAAEMLHNRQWLVAHFQGQPDLWNTKPPLLVWLQALSMQAFGYSEWAFRLPTALASLALVVLVAGFARRWLGGPLAGLLAGLALLTSKGFVTSHVARTGDYEALLLLFLTAQLLAGFAWLHTKQRRYLLWLGAAVGLAVLTKSVAGLFLLPGLALEIIRRKRLLLLVRQPATWVAVVLAVGPPALWYWLRERAAPGYGQAVWENELGGRLTGSLEQHSGEWYAYLTGFFSQQFLLWTPWVIAGAWALARRPTRRPAHRFLTLAAWSAGVLMVVISLASTKLPWYNAPVFPVLALLIGGGLATLARRVAAVAPPAAWRWRATLLVLLAVVPSAIALQQRRAKEMAHSYNEPELTYGRFLRDPAATPGPATHFTVLHRGPNEATLTYNASLEFYALAFRHAHPHDTLEVRYAATQLPVGRVVVVCGAAAQAAVYQAYKARTLYAADSCLTLQILAPR
jgi:4-amino-4-deoxy-L-arabinose transferase-like glycosyltransferase